MQYDSKISIAVCTFNGERFLAEQLQSLVDQSYRNTQIVIVDDCSTDGTRAILERFKKDYANIEVHYNEINLGYIKNFENALNYCTGDFIALCDQDDIWHLNKLEILLAKIKKDEIMLYHNSALISPEGIALKKNLSETIGYISDGNQYNLLLNNCIAGHAMMFRKSLLSKILPLPTSIPHDHWIAYVALTVGKMRYLKTPLVNYRQHTTSVTFTLHQKEYQDDLNQAEMQRQRKLKINNDRILHLHTLKKFSDNTEDDRKFIQKLADYLGTKNKGKFSFRLFLFMIWNQTSLFKLYHKSFFSNVVLIFKECKGIK
jgi:glycosyltransferase involved in cell wall biosynthesis